MIEITMIILKRKKYMKIALVGFISMFAISYFLSVINVSVNSIFVYAMINGYIFTIIAFSLIFFISFFTGIYLALYIFRKDLDKKDKTKSGKIEGLSGAVGAGINVIVSGCPTCGVPFLALIGIPTVLLALPFRGLELKLLSMIILLVSIISILKSIKANLACNLQK